MGKFAFSHSGGCFPWVEGVRFCASCEKRHPRTLVLTVVQNASSSTRIAELTQLEKEVDELKGLLDSTIDRLAELKRSDESRCRLSCV